MKCTNNNGVLTLADGRRVKLGPGAKRSNQRPCPTIRRLNALRGFKVKVAFNRPERGALYAIHQHSQGINITFPTYAAVAIKASEFLSRAGSYGATPAQAKVIARQLKSLIGKRINRFEFIV